MFDASALQIESVEFVAPVYCDSHGYIDQLVIRDSNNVRTLGKPAAERCSVHQEGVLFDMAKGVAIFVPNGNIKFIGGQLRRWPEGQSEQKHDAVAGDEAASANADRPEKQEVVHSIDPFGGAKAESATAAHPTIPPHPATQGRGRPRGRVGAAKAP